MLRECKKKDIVVGAKVYRTSWEKWGKISEVLDNRYFSVVYSEGSISVGHCCESKTSLSIFQVEDDSISIPNSNNKNIQIHNVKSFVFKDGVLDIEVEENKKEEKKNSNIPQAGRTLHIIRSGYYGLKAGYYTIEKIVPRKYDNAYILSTVCWNDGAKYVCLPDPSITYEII